MADRINLLPDVVANQIAAGEVVTSPASVVKEMVENAIDAGAKKIIINSREGGSELIQIVDDGIGFSPNDARMAFEKHATSKITSVDDIYCLSSFGFRGEALASINAVADVELRSRQEGDPLGTLTRFNSGEFAGQESVACEVGSNFMVRNLFNTLPARKHSMEKSALSKRLRDIRTEFTRIALCYPEVAFELYASDQLTLSLSAESLANRIVNVVGRRMRGNLLEVDVDTSIVRIKGFVGRPSAAKKSGAEQFLFVNGRYFDSSYFHKAILRGYEKLITTTVSPAYFLYLEVAPDSIDVNIHPQKTDVHFIEGDAIWQILLAAVRETLAKGGGVPLMEFEKEDDIEIPLIRSNYEGDFLEPRSTINNNYNPFNIEESSSSASEQTELGQGSSPAAALNYFMDDYEDIDVGSSTYAVDPLVSNPFAEDRFTSSNKDEAENILYEVFESTTFTDTKVNDVAAAPPVTAGLQNASLDSMFDSFNAQQFESVESSATAQSANQGDGTAQGDQYINAYTSAIKGDDFSESQFEFVASSLDGEQSSLDGVSAAEVTSVALLRSGYAAAVVNGELTVVDVRRITERIRYNQLMALSNESGYPSQQLLFVEELVLSHNEYELMGEHATDFALLGFDVDYKGDGAIEVRGIPSVISTGEVDTLLYELLTICASPENIGGYMREKLAMSIAYRSSLGVSSLSVDQIKSMLEELINNHEDSYTPNGKLIYRQMDSTALKVLFKQL